ncbi:hypothetical protein GNI_039920 [Gregarina niphandrodes]|uniref:Uncharacterized protein n=1 Tax=Gregarina niphandrodes TaxID=110365 RepID=A0A023BAC1_GRENI|nr:hypothetical protein GNI_039920 [Gregarina niphandrodes]EZG78192.1 hypothetical protein GNI_039920 [Gregarina niphandrodes]|eukprot:XP_011129412.1 hypothetical protein GNI_039920 [Gregarina niphandrodes]
MDFLDFFRDPKDELAASPIKDDFGVVIKDVTESDRRSKMVVREVLEYVDRDSCRAGHVTALVVQVLLERVSMPLLNLSSCLEDLLPSLVERFMSKEEAWWKEWRLPHFVSLTELRHYYGDTLGAAKTTARDLTEALRSGQKVSFVQRCNLRELIWCALSAASLILPPEAAHATLMGYACRKPLQYGYLAGITTARQGKKRAHFFTAYLASAASAIKNTLHPEEAVFGALDVLAGLQDTKWECCEEDAHNIMPLSLLCLCTGAIAKAARPEGLGEKGWKEKGWKEEGREEEGWKEEGWKEEGRKEEGRKEEGRKEEGRKEEGRKEEGWEGNHKGVDRSLDRPLDRPLSILLEYCHRFIPAACLWSWVSHMATAAPCDRGVGDMDITPLVQSIVFAYAYQRRLGCTLDCFRRFENIRRDARMKVGKGAYLVRSATDLDVSHDLYMGGLCNTMSSVYSPVFCFTQLLKVVCVMGSQAKAGPEEGFYVGEHWNSTVSAVVLFRSAMDIYYYMLEQDVFTNIHKLSLPLDKVIASVLYSLADYSQSPSGDSVLSDHCSRQLQYMISRYDNHNIILVHKLLVLDLLQYPHGPVLITTFVHLIDKFRQIWVTRLRETHPTKFTSIFSPLIQLLDKDDALLFWGPVIYSLTLLAYQIQESTGHPTGQVTNTDGHTTDEMEKALRSLVSSIDSYTPKLRLECQGKEDGGQLVDRILWQREQILM